MTAITTRALSDSSDSLLRFAMRTDAVLVGFTGLAGALTAGPLAELTGLTRSAVYGLVVFCIAYGCVVFALAALQKPRWAGVGVITANVVCTVAALELAETAAVPLTGAGTVAAVASSVYTAFFALLQYRGLRRLR